MPNIKQIAEAAGVSVTTVSRVLNDHPYVSEAKRKAVEEAIRKLNYSRNMNAVHLIKGTTRTIGVVLPRINLYYFARMMEGMAQEALLHNYQLMLCQTDYRPDEERKVLEMLRNKQIDGLVICSRSLSLDEVEAYAAYGPIALCEAVRDRPLSSVYIDHYAIFQKAITYLWEKGRRRIGFTAGRRRNSPSLRRRLQAYNDTLLALGGSPRQEWVLDGCYDIGDGAALVEHLLAMPERPDALLITGDQVAAGFILAARSRGLEVPGDFAVIGFDNQPISAVLGITTIDNRLSEIGARAFDSVRSQLAGQQPGPVSEELGFRFIKRGSV
ncbi:LacI family DNA-binding transcriptional regulator [Paenibacillus oralis]|uniref:LacI family DNA-binding transcriptional regulator n=1 Tax=Paenibacillus oralis TaxID=2490856 RepID=A0A3P3TWF1_9BACL|nr:LacI family DNA-binding transcriptional regulator [Paenibacillus oralis]RRJ62461.1 LacI family DNA-binding transcriptional regulator [Paenibacillus oralis]